MPFIAVYTGSQVYTISKSETNLIDAFDTLKIQKSDTYKIFIYIMYYLKFEKLTKLQAGLAIVALIEYHN